MEILLLDNDNARTQIIEKSSREFDAYIKTVNSVSDAKEELEKEIYDFIIVSPYVPIEVAGAKSYRCGYEFIKYIFENYNNSYIPKCIVFVSSNMEKVEYLEELKKLPISIIDTSSDENSDDDTLEWKRSLEMLINYCSNPQKQVDLVIVTAVEMEFNVIYNDDEWTIDKELEEVVFYRRTFACQNGVMKHAILVRANDKGVIPATILVSQIFENYIPNYIIMIGIAAGRTGKVNIGDIIVANKACDYSCGAISEDEYGNIKFEPSPHIEYTNHKLTECFQRYSTDDDLKFKIRKHKEIQHIHSDIDIKIGMIATGPSVIKNNSFVDKYIKSQNRDFIGIDMETYAIYYACNHLVDYCKCLSIKAVSDLADIHKDDEYQKDCVKMAYELLKYFVENDMQ